MRRDKRGRVYGPYEEDGEWRVIVVSPTGKRVAATFTRERDALAERLRAERELEAETLTMSQAIQRYRDHQIAKGNKPGSVETTIYRLRSLFTDPDEYLCDLSLARCQRLYDELSARVAGDTHRNTLGQARTFLRWAEKRGYVGGNYLAEVEPMGRRRAGKPQLYIDEARRFRDLAVELAIRGDRGALGALMAFLLGMRATEILTRSARDIDDGGRVLWIPDSKTELGRRTLVVPAELEPLLRAAALEGDPLFPSRDHRWLNRHVRRICQLAGVPRVPTHGLRGTHSSIGSPFADSASAVARALGHTEEVNRLHYTTPEAAAASTQRRLLDRLN